MELSLSEDKDIRESINIIEDIKGSVLDNISGINSFWHCILKSTNSENYRSLSIKDKNILVRKLRRKCALLINEDNTLFDSDEVAFEYIKAVNGHPAYAKALDYSHSEAVSRFIRMCDDSGKFGIETQEGYFPPNEEVIVNLEKYYLHGDEDASQRLSEILFSGEKPSSVIEDFDPFRDFSPEFLEKFYDMNSENDAFYNATRNEIDISNSFRRWYFTLLEGQTSFILLRQNSNRDTLAWELGDMEHPQELFNRRNIAQLLGVGVIVVKSLSEEKNEVVVYTTQNKECNYIIVKIESDENFYPISVGGRTLFESGSILVNKILEALSFDSSGFLDVVEVLRRIHLPPRDSEVVKSSEMRFIKVIPPSGEEEGKRRSSAFSGNTSLRASSLSMKKSLNRKVVTKSETYDFDFCEMVRLILEEKE